MDLNHLLSETITSLRKEDIGKIIGPDQEVFDQLKSLCFTRNMPLSWRAAWILDYLSELHPWLAESQISEIWSEIPNAHPDGVTRSLLRLLGRYDLPEEYQGIAADLCLDWLTKEAVPVAIKAHSMEILYKLALKYPELAGEFIAVMESQAQYNSAGFKARAAIIIKKLEKHQA